MKKQKILVDTDMGNDDIMAISMLLLSPLIKIMGISTVNGVSGAEKGLQNLSRVLNYCKENIPIVLGASKALTETSAKFPKRDRERAEKLTLLSKLQLPNTFNLPKNSKQDFSDFIFKKLTKECSTILTLGPLTNIALAIKKYGQQIKKRIERIIMMGGGVTKGNVPPSKLAEYNLWIDPEAADIVFNSGILITMVGIEATSYVPATKYFTNIARKIETNNPKAKIIKEIIVNNNNDFEAFYDPLAASILIDPSIFIEKFGCAIKVKRWGITRGQTLLTKNSRKNVSVILKVDGKKFYNLVLGLIKKYEKN